MVRHTFSGLHLRLLYLLIAFLALVVGGSLYLFHHKIIVILARPAAQETTREPAPETRRSYTLWYPTSNGTQTDTHTTIWSTDRATVVENVTRAWLRAVEEEDISPAPLLLETAALTKGTLYLSLNRVPWHKNSSAEEKFSTLGSLMQTLQGLSLGISHVQWLVHHRPLADRDLATAHPWPLAGSIGEKQEVSSSLHQPSWRSWAPFLLILAPYGDARTAGRVIEKSYERTLTLEIASHIQKTLGQSSHVACLLTRNVGETTPPHHVAQFANTRNPGLVISLTAYPSTATAPEIRIYVYGSSAEDLAGRPFRIHESSSAGPTFIPLEQAHKKAANESIWWALALNKSLVQSYSMHATIFPVAIRPYLPLRGIMHPALGIEIGIPSLADSAPLGDVLAHILKKIFKEF